VGKRTIHETQKYFEAFAPVLDVLTVGTQKRLPIQAAPAVGSHTPWGAADHVRTVADGIVDVQTPGHGGYWLSAARLEVLRAKFPELSDSFAGFPWFEEDCDWAYVALAFPEHFDAKHLDAAGKTLEWIKARAIEKQYINPETGRTYKTNEVSK